MQSYQNIQIKKKAVRIILKEKYNAHTEPIFKSLKLLKIQDLYTLSILKFYFKKSNHLLPGFYEKYTFKTRSLIHEHNIRGKSLLHLPKMKHPCLKNSLMTLIPTTVNNTDQAILDKVHTHSYQGFTKYFKSFYINNYSTECKIPNCYVCK